MSGRPEKTEAAPYYFRYIDLVQKDDVLARLEAQLDETMAFLGRDLGGDDRSTATPRTSGPSARCSAT